MSRIIVALDRFDSIDEVLKLVDMVNAYVAGYKIGLPLILRQGVAATKKLVERVGDKILVVDMKLADIGYIMIETVRPLLETGYRYFIAHGFIGYRGALEELSLFLRENDAKLIVVAAMSHQGSQEIMDKHMYDILDIGIEADAWGYVLPATRPELIKKARTYLDEKGYEAKILSPGIGAQGAEPGSALRSGADYEIIGRMITESTNPLEAVTMINKRHEEVLMEK